MILSGEMKLLQKNVMFSYEFAPTMFAAGEFQFVGQPPNHQLPPSCRPRRHVLLDGVPVPDDETPSGWMLIQDGYGYTSMERLDDNIKNFRLCSKVERKMLADRQKAVVVHLQRQRLKAEKVLARMQ